MPHTSKTGSHIRMSVLEAGRNLLELGDEYLSRIHRAPGIEIIVGEADHRGAIARRFNPEWVGGADLHRRAIDQAAVKGELTERLAILLPGPHHTRRKIGRGHA